MIPRIESLSAKDFRRSFWRPQRPVIVTDALVEWPALKKWSLEYFSRVIPDVPFLCEAYRDMAASADPQAVSEAQRQLKAIPFRDLPPHFRRGSEVLYPHCKIFKFRPDLLADVRKIPYFRDTEFMKRLMSLERPKLALAPASITTPFHYDEFHNFIAQISGQKHWTIFDPRVPHRAIEFELEAGDLLFLPRLWPHHVRTRHDSITLNYWVPVYRDLLRAENLAKVKAKALYHLGLRQTVFS